MGGCVAREDELYSSTSNDSDDLLIPDSGPFTLKVRFRNGVRLDAEAQVIKSLSELLWIEGPKTTGQGAQMHNAAMTQRAALRATAARCVRALKELKVNQSDTILDFVVPLVNVILHAQSQDIRNFLWEDFVMEEVEKDFAFAHIFFWALMSVATSPQALPPTVREAQTKLDLVRNAIFSKVQLHTTISSLKAANDAVRRGGPTRPDVPVNQESASPLINLLQRLHYIGEEIVKEKDRAKRLALLQSLVQKDINERLTNPTPVPVVMLAPHASPEPVSTSATAKLLQLTVSEARVLSSKARAPYLVVLEVEKQELGEPDIKPKPRSQGLLGRLLCPSRRPPPQETQPLTHDWGGQGSLHRWHQGGSSPSSPGSVSTRMSHGDESRKAHQDTRPKGCFNNETWEEVVERIRRSSQFGYLRNWSLLPLIIKSNADDVRQEELAYRLLKWFQRVFRRHKLKLWLQPFLIIATTHDGGCLEVVSNAISISDLKKSFEGSWTSLRGYFETAFRSSTYQGGRSSVDFQTAIQNFIWSMAAYSVICYVLAIRDRHNGNIMLDDQGHILHVDFGFMLCGAPGGKAMQQMGGFELANGFKLTQELVEVLGGVDERPFQVFREAVADGMIAVRQHAEELLALLQLSMLGSENSRQNCFTHPKGYPEAVLEDLCERLGLPGGPGQGSFRKDDKEYRQFVDRMVLESVDHWRSRLYDTYQYHFTGIH